MCIAVGLQFKYSTVYAVVELVLLILYYTLLKLNNIRRFPCNYVSTLIQKNGSSQ